MAHLVKSVKQPDREKYDRRFTEILDGSHIFLLALIISVSMSILSDSLNKGLRTIQRPFRLYQYHIERQGYTVFVDDQYINNI